MALAEMGAAGQSWHSKNKYRNRTWHWTEPAMLANWNICV